MGKLSKITRGLILVRVGLTGVLAAAIVAPALIIVGMHQGKVLKSANPEPSPTTFRIMPLGDSITEGNTTVVKNGYRLELQKKLEGYSIDYVGTYAYGLPTLNDLDTQGEGGACIRANPCHTTSMVEKTESWLKEARPDIVILNGGTNDYCCGREAQDDEVVRAAMRDWIQTIWSTDEDITIVVIGMPDRHPGYASWIPQHVEELASEGKEIHYVSLQGVDTYDSVHPNLEGYKVLAGRLAEVIRPLLAQRID